MKRYTIAFICAIIIANCALASTIKIQFTFDSSKCELRDDTIDNQIYTHISYEGLSSTSSNIGCPNLPIRNVNLIVPFNAINIKVSTDVKSSTEVELQHYVYPEQEQIPTSTMPNENSVFMIDSLAYRPNKKWPSQQSTLTSNGVLYNTYKIVNISLFPISYITPNKLLIHNEIELCLQYDTDSSVQFNNISTNRDKDPIIESIVDNPESVPVFAICSNKSRISDEGEIEPLNYCVITNKSLAPHFNRLISWKRQKGYSADIFCIEDILSNSKYINGDTISHINDDAGKLRSFLRELYGKRNLDYALLAGSAKILPVRYGCGIQYSGSNQVPTDMYFSELFSNWDKDQDGRYGEYEDNIGYYPSVIIGRLLCETPNEVENYVEKLICYETNPGNGNYNYLSKALYFQADDMQRDSRADTLAVRLQPLFTTQTIMQENPSYNSYSTVSPKGAEVISEMNNLYGYYSWNGHGNPGAITSMSQGCSSHSSYGISALDSYRIYMEEESNNGLDNLSNINFPAIAYSMSCTTMPFDVFKEYTEDKLPCNLGRSFTTWGRYGGVAMLGNTRQGYVKTSAELELVFTDNLLKGIYKIGEAEAISKFLFKLSSSLDHHVKLTHNLLGDPEFDMWTSVPNIFTNINTVSTNSTLTLSGNDINDGYIGLLDNHGSPRKLHINGNNFSINDFNPNSSIVVYKHNWIPKLFPLILQNCEIDSSNSYLVNSLKIGSNIDSNRISGDVLFMEGSRAEYIVYGETNIYNNVIIKANASITLNCSNNVNISGLTIQSGGKLIIFAPSVNCLQNIVVEKGAELIINNKSITI